MDLDDWHQTDRLQAGSGKGDPFAAAVRATRMPMIVTDPRQDDNPIVFANDAFLHLTGYARDELLGRNCRFLQGPETDRTAVARVRDAVRAVRNVNVDLLNYRKDGSTFWNALYVSPVVDERGELQFFFASQLDVTDRKTAEQGIIAARAHFEHLFKEKERALDDKERILDATHRDLQELNGKLTQAVETKTALLHEVDHRVKNNLQMVSSLVLLQSRSIADEGTRRTLREMLARIEALGTVHRRLYQSDDVTRFDVGEFIRDLVTDLTSVAAHERVTARFELEAATIPAELAVPLALIVNEVATNALKHAFPEGRRGTILARVATHDTRLRVEIADDGIGRPDHAPTKISFGMSLIKTLSRQLKAEIGWTPSNPGTRVTIDLPMGDLPMGPSPQ